MRENDYRDFSLKTHRKNWSLERPNVCRFELTFACGLHCTHCYSDCYNSRENIRKELDTKEAKLIVDKIYDSGVIWLCLTGGDPLTRADFLEIYNYAKEKGFIISIFTNGYSMTEETIAYFKNSPPFAVELTLNAATAETYEKISQVKGSFEKTMQGIKLMLEAHLPLKIKTQATKQNIQEMAQIKRLIEDFGLPFHPGFDLHPRLNGDNTPCAFRVEPDDVLHSSDMPKINLPPKPQRNGDLLFRCAAADGDIHIDPYGNMFLCNLIREPAYNLLEVDIEYARSRILSLVRGRRFISASKCKNCFLREFCSWCPGRARLEMGDEETAIAYYCRLAESIYNGTLQNAGESR
ncbi:MAG: radical SAM protein [Candidatus Omnitrophica bacterium]|nr:radical SAM protein [Candidatus Omnitrophota bacterium]